MEKIRQEEGEDCKEGEEEEDEEEDDVGEDSVKWVFLEDQTRPPVLERFLRALAGTEISLVRAKNPVRFSFDSVSVRLSLFWPSLGIGVSLKSGKESLEEGNLEKESSTK